MQAFHVLYAIDSSIGTLVVPDTFAVKVRAWLSNSEELYRNVIMQRIWFMRNRVTGISTPPSTSQSTSFVLISMLHVLGEASMFNALRGKRPMAVFSGAAEYVENIVADSATDCDFCNYRNFTAMESFGRIETEHAMTAANTFKYDAPHGLIMLRKHNPAHWTQEEFLGLMDTALLWLNAAHLIYPAYAFPNLMWDILPKASASQIHPHIQV